VLSAAELETVARICLERDLLAVTDEVYEHLVYDGRHIPLATLPGMAERTVTISSHGKTFSFTGWKVGWACGPADLIAAVRTAKQYLSYSGATPFQHAATAALGLPSSYYEGLAAGLKERRDLLCRGLRDAGFETFTPQGTYFATTDVASVGAADAVEFCFGLPERVGVVAVPMPVFYDDPDAGRTLVRFAFCKRPEILAEAAARLKGLRPQ
jgi:N-succinyldiaminopimelate aminotransferase